MVFTSSAVGSDIQNCVPADSSQTLMILHDSHSPQNLVFCWTLSSIVWWDISQYCSHNLSPELKSVIFMPGLVFALPATLCSFIWSIFCLRNLLSDKCIELIKSCYVKAVHWMRNSAPSGGSGKAFVKELDCFKLMMKALFLNQEHWRLLFCFPFGTTDISQGVKNQRPHSSFKIAVYSSGVFAWLRVTLFKSSLHMDQPFQWE